jgi:hypothetical protein
MCTCRSIDDMAEMLAAAPRHAPPITWMRLGFSPD